MSVVSCLEPWPSPDELASLRRAVLAHFANVVHPHRDDASRRGSDDVATEDDPGGHVHALDEDDVRVVAAPYRVCPLGAHIDHQGGVVAGLALNCGILLGFVPTPDPPENEDNHHHKGWGHEEEDDEDDEDKDDEAGEEDGSRGREGDDDGRACLTTSTTVCLVSDAFGGEVRFDVNDVPPPGHVGGEDANWGAYARGAAWAIRAWLADPDTDLIADRLTRGIVGVVRAAPPGADRGGVSSSAAVGHTLDVNATSITEGNSTSFS